MTADQIYENLVQVVQAKGHTASYVPKTSFTVDGINLTWLVGITEIQAKKKFGRGTEPSGKYQIVIGNYGSRFIFKQLKDGSFRYDDAADTLIRAASAKKREDEGRDIREKNRAIAKSFEKIYRELSAEPTEYADQPVRLRLAVTRSMSEKDAVEFVGALEALEKLGFLTRRDS